MAYEMIKLTGQETKEQLEKLKDDTHKSIDTLERYISDRMDYVSEIEYALQKLSTINDLI